MDDVVLGDGSIVGALSFVKANTTWEERSLIVGNPAVKIKEVTDKMHNHKVEGTELYRALPYDMFNKSKEVLPLESEPDQRHEDFPDFDTWMKRKR